MMYDPPQMSDTHLTNAYKSLKRRTFRDGSPRVFQANCDILVTLGAEMHQRGLEIPQMTFARGFSFTPPNWGNPEGEGLYEANPDIDAYWSN